MIRKSLRNMSGGGQGLVCWSTLCIISSKWRWRRLASNSGLRNVKYSSPGVTHVLCGLYQRTHSQLTGQMCQVLFREDLQKDQKSQSLLFNFSFYIFLPLSIQSQTPMQDSSSDAGWCGDEWLIFALWQPLSPQCSVWMLQICKYGLLIIGNVCWCDPGLAPGQGHRPLTIAVTVSDSSESAPH